MKTVDYTYLPLYMRDGARNYIEHGIEPGTFLRAVLENNLVKAFAHADNVNRESMDVWAKWLFNEVPYPLWGSPVRVQAWIDAHTGGGKATEQGS